MISLDNEPPEVELGDPPLARPDRRPRWTFGRVANDLLIAVFVASLTLGLLFPLVPGMCGNTPERDAAAISGLLLLARPARWLFDGLTRPDP